MSYLELSSEQINVRVEMSAHDPRKAADEITTVMAFPMQETSP